MGVGAGMALNPMILVAMSDVAPQEAGLASGVINTSFMMGGSLGLAVLAIVAATHGYGAAFLVGAGFAAIATVLCGAGLQTRNVDVVHPGIEAETST
jgi:MFS family permease